jgi:chromosome segregation ATPase
MKSDPAYLDLLDTILNLRSKLSEEETTVLKCKVRIHKLVYDLERCERYITYLENNLVSREDEIERLKTELENNLVSRKDEIERLKTELEKCRDHLDLKEEALVAQDERIIQLENTVDNLKKQILKLSSFQNHGNKKTDQESMSLPELFQNIGTALIRLKEVFVGIQQ